MGGSLCLKPGFSLGTEARSQFDSRPRLDRMSERLDPATASKPELRERIAVLEAELAEERGGPRPGEEQWDLHGGGSASIRDRSIAYFLTDPESGLQVNSKARTDLDSRRYAYRLLRRCLADVDGTAAERLHSTFCRCGSEKCLWSSLNTNEDAIQLGRSSGS